MSSPASSLKPWLMVAVAIPMVAVAAWAAGFFEAPPAAPIADRADRELERAITPAPADHEPGRTPLVIFLGDSRYLRALRSVSFGPDLKRPKRVSTPAGDIEILTYFARAGSSVADVGRFIQDIFTWKPDALVVQPELMVEETSMRGLAPAALSADARRRNWDRRLGLWADKVEMPEGGDALVATKGLVEQAERQGVRLMVAQIPPSKQLLEALPAGYHDQIRSLVCGVVADCPRNYLSFETSYPNELFRDPLHLNKQGREVFYPRVMEAVARALSGP
jgi:hypothetical protein